MRDLFPRISFATTFIYSTNFKTSKSNKIFSNNTNPSFATLILYLCQIYQHKVKVQNMNFRITFHMQAKIQ